jgi:hypothetical protein
MEKMLRLKLTQSDPLSTPDSTLLDSFINSDPGTEDRSHRVQRSIPWDFRQMVGIGDGVLLESTILGESMELCFGTEGFETLTTVCAVHARVR